jgi:hypothetical protein
MTITITTITIIIVVHDGLTGDLDTRLDAALCTVVWFLGRNKSITIVSRINHAVTSLSTKSHLQVKLKGSFEALASKCESMVKHSY